MGTHSFTMTLPAEVMAKFRTVSQERLDRIERSWLALTLGTSPSTEGSTLAREIHTLKGDARVVGLPEVGTLCQRLEEVVAAASARGFRVHEDVDIVVIMAIQLVDMLLRRKPGMVSSGIDLEGFLKQLDSVTAEWLRRASDVPWAEPTTATRRARPGEVQSAPAGTREKLGAVACEIFLEHLRTADPSRARLIGAFDRLAGSIGELAALPLAPIVEHHVIAAQELARELGKVVEMRVDVGEVRVGDGIRDVVHVIVLHLLRNAIDHGLELPSEREAKGTARVRVIARDLGREIELRIEDDGRGVDAAKVLERAVQKGICSTDALPSAADALNLLFVDGFSSRDVVTAISGRGVGLGAVKAEVEKVGGSISVSSELGKGTRFHVRLPRSLDLIEVYKFEAAALPIRWAVPADWEILEGRPERVERLADRLDVPPGTLAAPFPFELRREGRSVTFASSSLPTRGWATRICPTASIAPAEVVSIDGERALLVRPEHLPG